MTALDDRIRGSLVDIIAKRWGELEAKLVAEEQSKETIAVLKTYYQRGFFDGNSYSTGLLTRIITRKKEIAEETIKNRSTKPYVE